MIGLGAGSDLSESSSAKDGSDSIVIYAMNYAPEVAGCGPLSGQIGQYFSSHGMKTTVVTTPPHYPGWKVLPGYKNRYSSTRHNGARIIRAPLVLRQKMTGIWRLIAPASFALTSLPIIVAHTLWQRPKVIYCVEPTLLGAPFALLAGKCVGARSILHVQDLEVDAAFAMGHLKGLGWLRKFGYAFERFTLRRFDTVLTISDRMADKLIEKGVDRSRIEIVRNWVDLEAIYPLQTIGNYRDELGYRPNDFIVLYSGNIGAKQGLKTLLEAARQLCAETHIHFVIAGEGPVKPQLIQQYDTLPNVRFLPFQPFHRLNEFLNLADLHALPQDRDAADLVLPSKLGGMLASGKRIVATADPNTELANFLEGAAEMTPPGDDVALAAVILRVSKTPELVGAPERRKSLVQRLSKQENLAALFKVVFKPVREGT